MLYRLHPLAPPVGGLGGLTDQQRKFTPRMWDLEAAQQAMASGALSLLPTTPASEQMATQLDWIQTDAVCFFQKLQRHHYYASEWINLPHEPSTVYPADVYVMGYNKALKRENEKMNPKIYFKFTLKEGRNFVMLATCHPEKPTSERHK